MAVLTSPPVSDFLSVGLAVAMNKGRNQAVKAAFEFD